MFLDEISIQTSILIYAGLGFIFFLGFGYYFFRNPIIKGNSVFWGLILGCIRGLILASLLIAIYPFKIFKNAKFDESVEFIYLVDFPELMTDNFNRTFKQVDSIIKKKHPNLIWLDFKGQVVRNFQKPSPISRSLNRLNQTVRKLNKSNNKKEIFVLTDGNMNDLIIDLAPNIHIIPYGEISNKEQIEFSTTNSPIISVPGEEVHLPVEIWVKNFKQNKIALINIYRDGAFLKKQNIAFDNDHIYQIVDVTLKSNKLGKHKIKVSLDNGLFAFIDWNVVDEKATVYGFSDALDPDVGVLNRVAKNKFIKLNWSFDVNAKIPDQADKFIFMRILPNEIDKTRILNSAVLFLNTSKDKINHYSDYMKRDRHLKMVGESLWDLQMKEFQSQGSSAHIDSTIAAWFEDLYFNKVQILDSMNKGRTLEDDLIVQDKSNNNLGRNVAKLNFLANKNNIDLLEIDDLAKVDFVQQGQNLNFKQESEYIGQNIYFKLWVLLLILAEWLMRKFKELR